jgi:hypothetical protein
MAIDFYIENHAEFLSVVSSGNDDNLQEVLSYQEAVFEAIIKFNCKNVLCDERNLIYEVSMSDTFKLAEKASKCARGLAKIAIVCDAKFLESGKFYETVATNRGLRILVTSDYSGAIEWLKPCGDG